MRKLPLTDEETARIRDMTREGKTVREVAAALGISQSSCGRRVRALRRAQILSQKSRGVPPRSREMSEAINVRIIELAREGMTAAEIGAEIKMRPSTVSDRLAALRQDGQVPPKPTGKKRGNIKPLGCADYEGPKGDHRGFLAALTQFHQKPVPLPTKDAVLHQISPSAPLSCVGSPALLCERS